jgi:NAD+ diphosphatase
MTESSFGPVGSRPVSLPYSVGWLDRAVERRRDAVWIDAMLRSERASVIPMWRDHAVADGDRRRPLTLGAREAGAVLAASEDVIFLGLDREAPLFAADLSPLAETEVVELVGSTGVLDVRRIVETVPPAQAATLAFARGMLHWSRNQRYCGACGSDTEQRDGGHLRVCRRPSCARLLYPRIEPAVITLVESPKDRSRCLLARQRGASGAYALLAGFVEIGECLEDAVRREIAEEASVEVEDVTYQASQTWPFPAGLMIGFRARALSEVVTPDGTELEELRWVSRAEVRDQLTPASGPTRILGTDSIESWLLRTWLSEAD